ncbi:cytochrome c oxidase assembly protein [Aestuariivirga litoralis]|uniref:Cytochrome c oxidase assembly protein CtaG n=1 Tax=Aestuariivirga litoralis TaxID=2650924 RepID=A0A2W2AJX6_9HYPH|nr:cytochrome c oxidase assembly protein [Aestuariivirga litoralis]PZF75785.1 cytochrome c oxidase assembly protein [Aestuariivirga litoralis]
MAKTHRNTRVVLMSTATVVAMVGLTFASVPLYRLFCQVTGFGGTTQRADAAPRQVLDKMVSVRFDANTSGKLEWAFHPVKPAVKVRFGEQEMAYYEAVNRSDKTLTGTAVFNVTPPQAGAYFNKIQCFCFTEQTLKPGEKIEMPVTFFVDPDMLKDPDAAGVDEITLSYTFYPVDKPKAVTEAKTAAPASVAN